MPGSSILGIISIPSRGQGYNFSEKINGIYKIHITQHIVSCKEVASKMYANSQKKYFQSLSSYFSSSSITLDFLLYDNWLKVKICD